MNIFQAFHQVGVTVIVATHDATGISATQRRVLHIDHGELRSNEIIQSPIEAGYTHL
jgi:ABC-type ATPase involved in cell division